MKCFEFITLSFISLNLLSFSVENLDDYLEVAKVNAYQKLYSNCPTSEERFECRSNDQLELVLKLLKNGKAYKKFAPIYPESEIRRDRNGYVILTLRVDKDGIPINSKLKEAKCGQGDINIQKNWKMNCNMFVAAAKQAIADWRFDQVFVNDVPIERIFDHKFTFILEGSTSSELKSQIVDLPNVKINKINYLLQRNDFEGLVEFSKNSTDDSPVYYFYLAQAEENLGQISSAMNNYQKFINKTNIEYFHFNITARQKLVIYYYENEQYEKVIDLLQSKFGNPIKNYLRSSNNKAPANSFYALMLLASSYLLENENLRALNEFYYIVDNIDQHEIDDDFKNIILENSKNYLDYIFKNISS